MEKEGFGEEFSICPSFCFGGIRGGQVIHIHRFDESCPKE